MSVSMRTQAFNSKDSNNNSEKAGSAGLRRTATWSPQKSSGGAVSASRAKFGGKLETNAKLPSFGIDYTKKTEGAAGKVSNRFASLENRTTSKSDPHATPGTKMPFGTSYLAKDKPASQRPKSAIRTGASNPSRFSGVTKNDPPPPSFGIGSNQEAGTDRMAYFREAMQKEKEAAEKKEARKKKLEEDRIQKQKEAEEEEKRKKEEAEKEKKDEENEVPDGEKIKTQHVAKCKKREKMPVRRTMSVSNIVLDWVQQMVKDYEKYGVEVKNFSTSWSNGLAFCALIHRFNPDEFDFSELKAENRRHNFDLAFNTGAKVKNIPMLLDTNDMVRMKKPEPRSVQTYVQWIWSVYGPTSGYGPTPQEVQNAQLA